MSGWEPHPLVDVIWWNDSSFYIRCPYCEELHRHGFVSYESGLRVPHCAYPRPSYRYNFPDAYEIDKAKARFVNISTLEDLEVESDDEAVSLSSLSLHDEVSFDDSTETITIDIDGEEPFELRQIKLAISECVRGNVSEVKEYLEESLEKSIFLHGKNDVGNTSLILASRERNASMVSLLLDHGAEVNATNENRRTSLMEAALWGRLENAKILLSRGANPSLRDNKNHCALDLAQPTQKNEKERYVVAGGILGKPSSEPVYKEDAFNRSADRREIARILGGGKTKIKTNRQPDVLKANSHSFRRTSDGQSIIHCAPIRQYPISNSIKTIAVLERGHSFPTMAAMSGWAHGHWPSVRVSGTDWTEMVINVAAIVGHTLTADLKKDQGIHGRFQASHAEKQLIAYFLDRHVFLPEDEVPDPRFEYAIESLEIEMDEIAFWYPSILQLYELQDEKTRLERELFNADERLLEEEYDEELIEELKSRIGILNEQGIPLEARREVKRIRALQRQVRVYERKMAVHQRLNRISKLAPAASLSRATILISSPSYNVCEDCMAFKNKVNSFFGLSIELHECTQ